MKRENATVLRRDAYTETDCYDEGVDLLLSAAVVEDETDKTYEVSGKFGTMSVDELPGCCGVSVIHDLETFELEITDIDPEAPDEVENAVVHTHEDTVSALKSFLKWCGGGYVLATTIASNRKANALARDVGATELARFRNPKSGNNLILWGYQLSRPVSRRPARR